VTKPAIKPVEQTGQIGVSYFRGLGYRKVGVLSLRVRALVLGVFKNLDKVRLSSCSELSRLGVTNWSNWSSGPVKPICSDSLSG
jgi:hypothetical protein